MQIDEHFFIDFLFVYLFTIDNIGTLR